MEDNIQIIKSFKKLRPIPEVPDILQGPASGVLEALLNIHNESKIIQEVKSRIQEVLREDYLKNGVASKVQASNIDATRADRRFKVRTLHKHFLTRFEGRG